MPRQTTLYGNRLYFVHVTLVFLFLHAKNTAISSTIQKIESLVQYPVPLRPRNHLFFCCTRLVAGSTMAAEGSQGEIRRELDGEAQERDKQVSALSEYSFDYQKQLNCVK